MSKTAQNGKGSKPRGKHKEYAEAQIWCKCGKMKDRCKCKKMPSQAIKELQGKIGDRMNGLNVDEFIKEQRG